MFQLIQSAFSTIFHFLTASYFQQGLDPSLSSQAMKRIVILGGSYAGISTAHRILKQAGKTAPFKITLVSPNTHFYCSMASTRGLVPDQISDEDIFRPIDKGFKQYPASRFEFILASAESVDLVAKKVGITSQTGTSTLEYDFLILATGARAKGDAPFKGLGSTEKTKAARHDFQARVRKAKTIVVAGGGVTGCEMSGELAYEHGHEKEIIFIASEARLLSEMTPTVSTYVQTALEELKVHLKLFTKVKSSTPSPNGQTELLLSTGEKLVTDLYIPAFGLTPNSSYMPSEFVNARGYVVVDAYLKVFDVQDVWAIGDVSACEWSQFIPADKQSDYLAKALVLILNGKTPTPYKMLAHRIVGVSIGRKKAVAQWGTWIMPNFLVVWARKSLFMNKMGPILDGTAF